MSVDDSVFELINNVQQGDDEAASALWDRYFPQILRIARVNLHGRGDRAFDEEDVATSVLESFFEAVRKDRFPNLRDRSSLWRLLSEMTRRKAIDHLRHYQRRRRGGGKIQGESAFDGGSSGRGGIGQIQGDDLTPELITIFAENCNRLLTVLDENLQRIALLKLEGFTNKEVAIEVDCSVATVERRLQLIRKKWERLILHEQNKSFKES